MSNERKIINYKGKEHLQCKSFSTTHVDAYEAGLAIGEALNEIKPEVIILFSSFCYDFDDMMEGLYSQLNEQEVVVIGGTGDGFYETSQSANHGVSALGINSNGKITWSLSLQTEAASNPGETAQTCARDLLEKMNGKIDLALVLATFNCDGVKVVDGIKSVLNIPFLGALTGDDWSFKEAILFANGKKYTDAICILGMSGEFAFSIGSASGWKPMGKSGTIDDVDQNVVHTINGKTAFDFLEEQFGIPPAEASLGVIPLAAYESPDAEHFYLRTPRKIDLSSGHITYFGTIPQGTPVRVCNATEDDVLQGVNDALASLGKLDFEPLCAIVISCGARKWILEERMIEETLRIFDQLGYSLPLIGTPSFGEMGPFHLPGNHYSRVFFHNVSLVIVLIGI